MTQMINVLSLTLEPAGLEKVLNTVRTKKNHALMLKYDFFPNISFHILFVKFFLPYGHSFFQILQALPLFHTV